MKQSAGEESRGKGATPETDSSVAIARVGAKVRSRRKQLGLTLNDLSDRTGVSVSMLSMLERGIASASIGTLVAVASALSMHLYDLFDHPENQVHQPVTRREEQPQIETGQGVLRRVVHDSHSHGIEMVINEYEPQTASADEATHHMGWEFGIVLSGTMKIEVDGVEHTLRPGDAINYDSTIPHRLVNPGRTKARTVWVNLSKT